MPEENLKHKTKIGMYWTFLNQASTQIMNFVVGIVMARILSPSDYGITALPGVFLAVARIYAEPVEVSSRIAVSDRHSSASQR